MDVYTMRKGTAALRSGTRGLFLGLIVSLGLLSCEQHTASLETRLARVQHDFRIMSHLFEPSIADPTEVKYIMFHDPFSGDRCYTMAYIDGWVVIYSVGPDGEDNGGTVHYDPTNGSLSAGDVVTRLRRP